MCLSKARIQSDNSQRLLNDTSCLSGDCLLCRGLLISPEPFPHSNISIRILFNYPGNGGVMSVSCFTALIKNISMLYIVYVLLCEMIAFVLTWLQYFKKNPGRNQHRNQHSQRMVVIWDRNKTTTFNTEGISLSKKNTMNFRELARNPLTAVASLKTSY